jgi:probable rRNA maturation factor
MTAFQINICCEFSAWETTLKNLDSVVERISVSICNLLQLDGRDFEINILLSCDEKLQELNRSYRQKDKPTNVLSFPFFELKPRKGVFPVLPKQRVEGMTETLGDLAVSYETTHAEAISQNKSFEEHFIHLCIHGILHLLGYDHINNEDADCMEELEIRLLMQFGIANPYILTETE